MVNLLDIIHINELWCMKSISILNHESQVIYSEPTSNAEGFEEYFFKTAVVWGQHLQVTREKLKKNQSSFQMIN